MPTPDRFSPPAIRFPLALIALAAITSGCLVINPYPVPAGTASAPAVDSSEPAVDTAQASTSPATSDDNVAAANEPLRPAPQAMESEVAPASASTKGELRPAVANLEEATPAKREEKDPADALRQKRRKLASSRRKLELAQLEREDAMRSAQQAIRQKEASLQNAMAKLTAFVEAEQPNRIQESEVDLESAENRHQDAVDELAQLEMMYKDSELEERTSEIVLNRGRRQLAVAERRLGIRRTAHRILLEHTLPLQKRELELKVSASEQDVEASRRKLRITELRQTMSILELEEEIADLERAIQKLEKSASSEEEAAAEPKGSL